MQRTITISDSFGKLENPHHFLVDFIFSHLAGEEGDFDSAYYDEIDAEFEKFLQEQDD